MILKQINQEIKQDFSIDQHHFKVVSDQINLNLINFEVCDGVIINTNNSSRLSQVLFKLRNSEIPSIYLKPIFLNSRKLFKKFKNELDGFILDENNYVVSKRCLEILNRVENIQKNVNNISNIRDKIIVKTLQYSYTRNVPLTPYRERFSPIGYTIPFLSSIIQDQELISVFKALDQLTKKSILTSSISDKINLCSDCSNSYLNFHETCVKCSSLDLKYENLVHHFRCAYIGPESDFTKDDKLICPKCDKQLKHIGIDYDKPSEIAHCQTCNHSTQETVMAAKCVDCGEVNELSQLSSHDIRNYELTSIGEQYIFEPGSDSNEESQKLSNLRVVPAKIFDLLILQEQNRVKSSKRLISYLGNYKIKQKIFAHLNEDSKVKVKLEIINILNNYLRPIDIICALSTNVFSFILPDIPVSEAKQLYETMLDNLNKILTDNVVSGEEVVKGDLRKL